MSDQTPNHGVTDDELIARMRGALDEVAAAPPAVAADRRAGPRGGLAARRWMAIAAAAALVVAGVAAIAVNRGDSDDLASTPTDSDATATMPTVRQVTSDGPVDWYVLASPDLIAGDLQSEQCCPPMPAPGPTTVVAWGATTGLQDGLMVLISKPRLDGSEPELTYLSNGFSAERASELQGEVVPGSGLPYVLPDDGVQLLGSGFDGIGTRLSQTYANSSGGAVITVGDYRGQLSPLVEQGFRTVDMPALGVTGYRADIDGNVYVVWQAPNGQWATLEIFPGLADRADGIIAAVVPSFAPTITGTPAIEQPPPDTTAIDSSGTTIAADRPSVHVTTVAGEPLPDFDFNATVDPAVGMTAPSFGGIDGGANSAIMPGRSPLLIVITAPWCPHCRRALPTVIAADNDGLLGDHALVLVETAPSAGSAVLSTHDDYAAWGYDDILWVDTDNGDGRAGDVAAAYGTTGYPYFVLIDADGKVMRRAAGEMTTDDLVAFVNG